MTRDEIVEAKPDQINAAVAELQGWRNARYDHINHPDPAQHGYRLFGKAPEDHDKPRFWRRPVPDIVMDDNAAFALLICLEQEGWEVACHYRPDWVERGLAYRARLYRKSDVAVQCGNGEGVTRGAALGRSYLDACLK
jgi:hypothetical protein